MFSAFAVKTRLSYWFLQGIILFFFFFGLFSLTFKSYEPAGYFSLFLEKDCFVSESVSLFITVLM